ncbi:hypothetical protein Tco_0490090, partial [Tanacetum coccineum]
EPESTSAPKAKTSKTTGKSTNGSKSQHKFAGESAHTEEPMHTDKDLEEPIHQEFDIGATAEQSDEETSQYPDWFQKPAKPPTPDRPRESFDELLDTPLEFLAFMMNRLKIDTLTPELLAGLTFELIKGTCKSFVKLECFFEEVYKATTDRLDWHNPEDYSNIKWIEDLVPNTMWSEVPVNYDKHALWGISHWGRKHQQFYGFVANRESARDVYSKRRIIAVTKLQLVEWHGYKHLDWITVRKLINLNVEDRLAFGVFLRMFTRSIVIQRRVEDLQLGVESYQKKLNITNPDTYRSDLKHRQHTPIPETSSIRTKTRTANKMDSMHSTLSMYYDYDAHVKGELLDCDEIPKRPTMYLNLWSYKVVRHRYSNPMIQPELEGSTQGYPLVRIEVLREHAEYDESNTYMLERFNTASWNHVNEILLKLNLPDHRSILTDSKPKMNKGRELPREYLDHLNETQADHGRSIDVRLVTPAMGPGNKQSVVGLHMLTGGPAVGLVEEMGWYSARGSQGLLEIGVAGIGLDETRPVVRHVECTQDQ